MTEETNVSKENISIMTEEDKKEPNYLEELSDLEDDFDVEVKVYSPPPSFKEFALNPFPNMGKKISTECKTGSIKLPKDIIVIYTQDKGWSFENYHQMELMALLYLHYYKDCDEWQEPHVLDLEIRDILEALPHFRSVNELLSYAFIHGDLKYADFEQVVESDSAGTYDVTGLNDD